jgi:NitT/TauT family transport system ATP-binding protein
MTGAGLEIESRSCRPPMAAPMVDIAELGVVYRTKTRSIPALKGCSFSVGDTEFVSILGPSGCGKSTLLRVVSGLMAPSHGSVLVGGEVVRSPRQDVGIVFQKPTLLPWRTVLANVLAPVQAHARATKADTERAIRLLELVGLEAFADNHPSELSGGMQQRVAIARCLAIEPRVMLMDEPFAALDAMSRERMSIELQRIWLASPKSVIFITHSIPEAVFLSDKVITLSGRPGEVIDQMTIDIPRPRTVEVMAGSQFGEYCNRLRGLFGAVSHV